MQNLLGIIVGLAIAAVALGGLALLIGGSVVAAVTAVASLPVVFPLTTTAVAVVLGVLWLRHRREQRRHRRNDD